MPSWAQRAETTLDLLYQAATDPGGWPDFLASTARTFEACTVCLLAQSPRGPKYSVGAAVGLNDHAIQLYNEYYASVDPWHLALQKLGAQEWVGLGSDLCPPLDFGNSEFYFDYLKKQAPGWYQAGIVDLGAGSVLTLHKARTLKDSRKRDVRFLRDLQPHVRRALAIHRKFAELRDSLAQVNYAVDALDIAPIGLGPDHRIRFTNLRGGRATASR